MEKSRSSSHGFKDLKNIKLPEQYTDLKYQPTILSLLGIRQAYKGLAGLISLVQIYPKSVLIVLLRIPINGFKHTFCYC